MVERRRGGETGVSAVRCFEGDHVWTWTDRHPWAARLLDHAAACCQNRKEGTAHELAQQPLLFLLDYRSGLQAACYLLNGYITSAAFAADIAGSETPIGAEFKTQARPHAHFSGLVYHIEEMMLNGQPSYPVERTLLTTGAMAAVFDSSYHNGRTVERGRWLETPHLHIPYRAGEASLFQRGPMPETDPNFGIGP